MGPLPLPLPPPPLSPATFKTAALFAGHPALPVIRRNKKGRPRWRAAAAAARGRSGCELYAPWWRQQQPPRPRDHGRRMAHGRGAAVPRCHATPERPRLRRKIPQRPRWYLRVGCGLPSWCHAAAFCIIPSTTRVVGKNANGVAFGVCVWHFDVQFQGQTRCGRRHKRRTTCVVVQSCSRAVVRSCDRAVVRSCGRAVVRSCGRAVVLRVSVGENALESIWLGYKHSRIDRSRMPTTVISTRDLEEGRLRDTTTTTNTTTTAA